MKNWYTKNIIHKAGRESLFGITLFLLTGKSGLVPVYRAVAKGIKLIYTNDYITLSRKFAVLHSESNKWYEELDQWIIKAFINSKLIIQASNPGLYFYSGALIVKGLLIHIARVLK